VFGEVMHGAVPASRRPRRRRRRGHCRKERLAARFPSPRQKGKKKKEAAPVSTVLKAYYKPSAKSLYIIGFLHYKPSAKSLLEAQHLEARREENAKLHHLDLV
jgi:hypothetical protein